MRLRAINREAWRDIATGASGILGLVLVLAVVAAVLACLDGVATGQIYQAIERYSAAGADIKIVRAPDRIDPVTCDQFRNRDDVSGAGAIRDIDSTRLLAAPNVALTTYEVSLGFSTLLVLEGDNTGIMVSEGLASQLGLRIGDEVVTADGSARLTGIFIWNEDGRDARLGYSILTATTLGAFDECWARIEPGHGQAYNTELLTTAVVSQSDSGLAEYGQVNNALGQDIKPSSMVNDRVTRPAPLIAAIAGLMLGIFAVGRRRLVWASNLHAGASRVDIVAIIALEALVHACLAAIIAFTGTMVCLNLVFGSQDSNPLVRIGAVVIGSATVGFPVGAVLCGSLIRETSTYKWFKNR